MAVLAPDRSRPAMTTPVAAVLVMAIFQILTPLLPLLGIGQPIGAQSDAVRTVITPAGWAFSIWGALYTGSLLFAVYQALPAQRDNALLARLRWPAAGAFLGNGLWAAYTQVAGLGVPSVAIIVWTLGCLLFTYRILSHASLSLGERWFAYLPLSALAAWLTVATTVNIAATLRFVGVEGGSATLLIGAAVIIVAGAIGHVALRTARGNIPYAAVMLWAFAAIYAANGPTVLPIVVATGLAAVLILTGIAAGARRARPAG